MGQKIPWTKPLYRQIFDVQSFFFYLLVFACLLSALLIFVFWTEAWAIWILGFLIIAAWMPLVISTMKAIYHQHRWLAFLYLLVVAQAAHMIEHLAQMVELHILGLRGPQANGIIGFLNVEWVHLIWNSWVLVAVFMLLFAYRSNVWLWILFIFAIYHEIEHIYMVAMYIKTGMAGDPGLLAHGGLIGGGLPISRPDLHALYAVLEEVMLLMIYFIERRKLKPTQELQTNAIQFTVS
ncbi:hypothetical protein KSF_011510 [Reticulibacter mediterranei]|uniref:Uncharacterized protein n=1 Tax=Reticulibacter mediterranei TaxID=2778369 RepID=A0A8J3N039_9CHLR|nr:hypothetical protein [Reticulibacter mediterranei]GHO91103.1 hypothetical protein KSF_011510 [Reticulibacter mediterranei]